MASLRRFFARLVGVFRRGRGDQELAREIAAHLTLMEDEFRHRGFSPEQARIAARRSFGGVERAKEYHRDARMFRWLDDAWRDLSYALRSFRRNLTFTAVAISTVALSIGAAVAMFSIVYGVLVRPLPYPASDDLVLVQGQEPVAGGRRPLPTPILTRDLDVWRSARTFARQALYVTNTAALQQPDGAELIDAAAVSPEFFATLGGPLVAGRGLTASDDRAPAAVISERLARRLFGDRSAAVNRSLTLSSGTYSVVGVAANDYQFPTARIDVWLPLGYTSVMRPIAAVQMVARLAPGATMEQANREFESIAKALPGRAGQVHGVIQRVRELTVAPARTQLLALFAAVAFLLLIACLNLVNLWLARKTSRSRELAVRTALGASRARLARQAIVEATAITAVGGLVGIALAAGLTTEFRRAAVGVIPRAESVRLDVPVFVFAVFVILLTTLASAVVPATATADAPLHAGHAVSGWSTRLFRRVLCTLELAASCMLLVAAILFTHSLVRLLSQDFGVSADHVVTASLQLTPPGVARPIRDEDTVSRVARIIEHVRDVPGVRVVAAGTALPPTISRIQLSLRAKEGGGLDFTAAAIPVTPDYFSALRIRLLNGRFFTAGDDAAHAQVLIVTERTARSLFGADNPVGRTVTLPLLRLDGKKGNADCTVVGVVSDVKYAGLTAPAEDVVYRPFAQQPWIAPFLVVRTADTIDPSLVTRGIRRAVVTVDPAVVVSAEQTLDTLLSTVTAPQRFQTIVLVSLTILALAIAAVGLYGVIAFSVAQRTHEFGIRLAVGASPARLLRGVMREGLTLALAGLLVGFMAAAGFVRSVQSLLYGITPMDSLSFEAAAAVLLVVTLVATYVPARAATKVDPLAALRVE